MQFYNVIQNEEGMATMLTAAALKKRALELGADDVGIGAMDRFEGAPPEMDPRRCFPDCKSVICLLFRIPRGCIRGNEQGTNFFQYPAMGYAGINEEFAPTVLYHLGRMIEDHGFEACVFRNTGGRGAVSDMTGKPGYEESPEEDRRAITHTRSMGLGKAAPDLQFHFRIAAFICGLGEIGYSKMFLSRKFGPLNRQAYIFTDATLDPDPLYDGPPLCDHCKTCASQCSGGCISKERVISINVAGRQVEWGALDEWSCFAYYEGACKTSNPFLPEGAFDGVPGGAEIAAGRKRITAEEYPAIKRLMKQHYPSPNCGYNPPKCGGCLRACVSSCERRGVLTYRFANKFRVGKPWRIS